MTPQLPTPAPTPRRVEGDEDEPTRNSVVPASGAGRFFAAWIGLGFLLGFAVGALVASTTQGPAMVSAQRSFFWLGMVFGIVGAFAGAVAALVVDGLRARRRAGR